MMQHRQVSITFLIFDIFSIAHILKELHKKDREGFDLLIQIAKYVQNNHVDNRKFATFRTGICKFTEQKGRRMAYEEAVDYGKTLFEELKFIEMLANFCKDTETKENEQSYTNYISIERLSVMNEILSRLPVICKKAQNISTSIREAMNSGEYKKNKVADFEKYHSIQGNASRNDPHVQKLLEMIYMNVSKRFQVFGNAYCYLDFKNRQRVSLSDFIKGMDGFALKITPADAKLVFRYLTDTQD